jgi:hypothetical protein
MGGVELPVRELVDPLRDPGDADVLLHEVVVGSEVGVAERPVLAVTVVGRRLKSRSESR